MIAIVDQLHDLTERIIKPITLDPNQHDAIKRRATNFLRRVALLEDQINEDPNLDMLQIGFTEINLELDRIIQMLR